MVKKGVAGYFYFQPTSIRTLMMHPGNISGTANVQAFWKPYLDKMASFPTMKKAELSIFNYGSYKHYFDAHYGAVDNVADDQCPAKISKRHGPGSNMAVPTPQGTMPLDSRLLSETHLTSPKLKAALKAASPGLQGHLVANPALKVDNTSVLPAWRKAYVHLIGTKVPPLMSVDSLRRLAPEMGAYVNEVCIIHLILLHRMPNKTQAYHGEQYWKETFWGANYPKLSALKSKYDPNMVFWASPGINADLMEVRQGRLCKSAKVAAVSQVAPKTDNQNSPRLGANSVGMGFAPKGKSGCGL